MNKELQALEDLFISSMTNEKNVRPYEDIENDYDVIKSALERLEGYENHTTFTMVNQINALGDENEELRKRLNGMYELREQYHLDQKKLKAFEIIKEKRVNVDLLSRSNYVDVYNIQTRAYATNHRFQELAKEEFDLLKEMFENAEK